MISSPSIIVTVTDENPTNQNALKLFVRSANKNNSCMLHRLHVIHPKTVTSKTLFKELDEMGVKRHAYNYVKNSR